MKKLWAILVHLSHNMWPKHYEDLYEGFDEDTWSCILEECHAAGLNAILLDVGDGVEFDSHPEIRVKNAWSKERVHQEVARCRELGITLIPKLNFSTSHHQWLGDYTHMVSSQVYYRVAKDLITEVYEMFEKPPYIHLGMDEEDARHSNQNGYHVFRSGEALWHDMRYLMDCVTQLGATPWIWMDFLFAYPEAFKEHIGTDRAVISPWYYKALFPEHFTPLEDRPDYAAFFGKPEWANKNIRFCEDAPDAVQWRADAEKLKTENYRYAPCASVYDHLYYNTEDMVRFYRDGCTDEQMIGYVTAPWYCTVPDKLERFTTSIRLLKEARQLLYPEE